jgi:hypothetical protein
MLATSSVLPEVPEPDVEVMAKRGSPGDV